MDLTKPPIPTFRRLPQPYHLSNSIDCLVALATGDGDARDCNKAAEEIVDALTDMFDAVVEYAGTLPEFVDLTHKERGDFIYYSIMERQGHGVGLTCDPGRFPEKAIDLARDKTSDLYGKVGAIVDWIEQNLTHEIWPVIKGDLCIEVSVYTADSVEDSEAAASTFPTAVGVNDVLDDVIGFAEDAEPATDDKAETEPSDISLELFLGTLDKVLDEYAVEQIGRIWCVSLSLQELLSRRNCRDLPRISKLERRDDESDKDWDRRSEVIGVDVSWWFETVATYDANGPTETVDWYKKNPEDLIDELVRSTDWYYKQYTAAKAAAEAAE
jgi:hypothetical protein